MFFDSQVPILVMRTPCYQKGGAQTTLTKRSPGSPSKHFDERLIAIEEILGDELHWNRCGGVVEARDNDIGRFVKSGTSRQLLKALPFNLQNRRALGNVPNYRAGVLMAAGLLIGLKRNLANIDRSYLPVGKSYLQKWLAEDRGFGHGNLMSRNTEGRNPRLGNTVLAGRVRCARAALARNASAAAAVGRWKTVGLDNLLGGLQTVQNAHYPLS